MRLFAEPGIKNYRDTIRLLTRNGKTTSVGVLIDPMIQGTDFGGVDWPITVVRVKDTHVPHIHYMLTINAGSPEGTAPLGLAPGILRECALVFYFAEHKRQRVQVEESTVTKMLSCGCYGAGVIALMRPDDRLIFRHTHKDVCFKESVFFDGDRLCTTTREE